MNYQIYQGLSICLDSNSDKRHQFSFKQKRKISGFLWNIPDISRIYPSQGTQAMLTQRQRKFELFFNPSQAKPRSRSSLRSTGKVQQCSLTQWLHNQTSCTCAALQWQRSSGRGAAQRSSRHTAAAGRLRSIFLVCVLHNTITLTLTAVRTVKIDKTVPK